jgi:hypothetical protein
VDNHGGEHKDLMLTITISKEERRYLMYLEDQVAFFTTLATFDNSLKNICTIETIGVAL